MVSRVVILFAKFCIILIVNMSLNESSILFMPFLVVTNYHLTSQLRHSKCYYNKLLFIWTAVH